MPERDSDTSSESERTEDVLREDSEGWEDAEPDEEVLQIKDFFSDQIFPNAQSMIENCKQKHDFDFLKIQKELGLDFYGSIKLVNYLRSELQKGNTKPDVSSKSVLEDDQYLQPALEDDALLFCLDELSDATGNASNGAQDADSSSDKVAELEEQLTVLKAQFAEYREVVGRMLDERWTSSEGPSSSKTAANSTTLPDGQSGEAKDEDSGYFEAYSYNDIHQLMLQDNIRTDAYRDFIYNNKHLFAGKTVLDVGCGTGILSMFCAKAGAAKVISVDNSAIIEKARTIVSANGLDDRITFVRGKVEEITLPDGIEKVDIIVSEWMGYCLLFEAMAESVLYARDRYLKPDGLMVPSHTTLQLGALEDPEHVATDFTFWKDVYGFDMTAMMEKIYDDVLVDFPEPSAIAGRLKDGLPFKTLDMHTISKKELQFEKEFQLQLSKDIDALDGFSIWFDTIFLQSRDAKMPENLLRGVKAKGFEGEQNVVFTTGPDGKATHWKSGICMIDRAGKVGKALKEGQEIKGRISFLENRENKRAVDISLTWDAAGSEEKGHQRWFLR